MDTVRGPGDQAGGDDREGIGTETIAIGTDERRMHVRAYNHWVSLLGGRDYPAISDLDPGSIADFGPNSVLLDFTGGVEDPAVRFLGRALREECTTDHSIARISDVPGRSLLSRLTDHYLQIIANHAPIGFEAEFVSIRGYPTMYRGILMPFSSDGITIDYIYGVINWKELVDAAMQSQLTAELEEARRTAPRPAVAAAAWADGPSAGFDTDPIDAGIDDPASHDRSPGETTSLPDRLVMARETAATFRQADHRSRSALYQALSRAYDFALASENDPAGYAELLDDSGVRAQTRAPMTPIVKLIFGVQYDKARLTEYAAVLSLARRKFVAEGGFVAFVEASRGGMKALVHAERNARRPSRRRDQFAETTEQLRRAAPIAKVPMQVGQDEFVLLLARADGTDTVSVLGRIDANDALVKQAIRKLA